MVNLESIEQIKNNELEGAKELISRLKHTPSSAEQILLINSQLMATTNKLLGKYFNLPKKAIVHTYGSNASVNHGYNTNATLQMSNRGIGKTSGYRMQIEVYHGLISDTRYTDSKGFLKDVVENDIIYDKVRKNLSTNGQEILDTIKNIYKEIKIERSTPKDYSIKLKLSELEKTILNLKEAYLIINDGNDNISLSIRENKNSFSYNDKIDINNLNINDPEHFVYISFIQNHAEEINNFIDTYLADTKNNLEKWKTFKEKYNEQLAKYVLLDKI